MYIAIIHTHDGIYVRCSDEAYNGNTVCVCVGQLPFIMCSSVHRHSLFIYDHTHNDIIDLGYHKSSEIDAIIDLGSQNNPRLMPSSISDLKTSSEIDAIVDLGYFEKSEIDALIDP